MFQYKISHGDGNEERPGAARRICYVPRWRRPGHPFYRKLEAKLKEAGFDRFCEEECKRYYADGRGGHHWFPACNSG
jgi:hypothetical protein